MLILFQELFEYQTHYDRKQDWDPGDLNYEINAT